MEIKLTNLNDLKIKIFADGADSKDILELNQNKLISGFTTNPSLMRKSGVTNYKNFAIEILKQVKDKPISFEVFDDEITIMEKQAYEIASWGNNVNVKIPITNTKGDSTSDIIKKLSNDRVICNITAIFTIDQVKQVIDVLSVKTTSIISVFAGRIADTGLDPIPLMKDSLSIIKQNPQSNLLWASPREMLNIFQANQIGCDIITVGKDIINKFSSVDKNLELFSLETVKMFYNDAQKAGYKIFD